MRTSLLLLLAAVALCLPLHTLRAAETAAPGSPEGVEWIVREINGKLAAPSGQRGLPTLRLDAGKKQASGFAGVNRFFGGYELAGDKLKFGALGATMMAGPDDQMATETAFLQALQGITNWRINKTGLELLKGEKVFLRFTVGAAGK